MRKTRELFKKIGGIKGTFYARMGTIKDRKSKDLREAEEIKKRWQEYTGELHKKGLSDQDNHDQVVTHLEPDILECEVKWALGSITTNKASGGDGIPAELFSNPKRWCCESAALDISSKRENSVVALVVNNPPANAEAPPRKPHLGKQGQGGAGEDVEKKKQSAAGNLWLKKYKAERFKISS